jgi:cation diffusion facilitator family transporter
MIRAASTAEQEKSSAARNSVIAAVALTVFKIIVGVATNSLGILAEAAHSGLDLVAAIVTWVAVRLSGRPADDQHTYGHGKIENLSALFETLLLLATSVWIIYESIQRLFFKSVQVEVSVWAFIVMATSILIDVNRSRMLTKAAKKFNSQALEADALHFSTDIWSSSVVIFGLVCVALAQKAPTLKFLDQADAIAALVVAGIVILISVQLGIRTVQALLDTAPDGLTERIIQQVQTIPGVINIHAIRARQSGAHLFIDAHLHLDGNLSLNDAHTLTEKVEQVIQVLAPNADVTVHPEPADSPAEG